MWLEIFFAVALALGIIAPFFPWGSRLAIAVTLFVIAQIALMFGAGEAWPDGGPGVLGAMILISAPVYIFGLMSILRVAFYLAALFVSKLRSHWKAKSNI